MGKKTKTDKAALAFGHKPKLMELRAEVKSLKAKNRDLRDQLSLETKELLRTDKILNKVYDVLAGRRAGG